MNILKYSNQRFAHHHVHSEYSPWDAPTSLKKLVELSKDLGYKTVTITDHGTVSAWVKLSMLCKDNGLRPIFGIEGYFTANRHIKTGGRDSYHILLLAKNNQGLKNIMRMSELAWTEGKYYDPRVDWELLEKYHEGVLCTSACVSGLVPYTLGLDINDPNEKKRAEAISALTVDGKLLTPYEVALSHAKRFQRIFGKDFWAELQYHDIRVETIPYGGMACIAKELGLGVVGTNDVHYLRKQDANIQKLMMALKHKQCVKDMEPQELNQLYLKSPDEMIEMFGGVNTRAIQGALEIADICDAKLETGKTQLPSIDIPKEFKTDIEYLEHLAREGMKRIGKEGNPVYEARFKEELDVIRRLRDKGRQFDRYFLVVWDYVRWAWDNGIRVGVGRGSGCGSLLLYCLRITGLDPIPYDLLFERFLDEDRNEMPDIDIDFDAEKEHLVYEYVCKKYGMTRCARITTYQTFHAASAIKAAFKVFDPGEEFEKQQDAKLRAEHNRKASKNEKSKKPGKEESSYDQTAFLANEITKLLPKDGNGAPSGKCTFNEALARKKPDEYTYIYDDPQFVDFRQRYPDEFAFAEKIEGLIKDRSVHASGVLITQDELVEICPQQHAGADATLCTAFDMNDVEKIGCVKFDFLSTKVLSIISRTIDMIKERYNKKIDIDNLAPNDPKAIAIFTNAETLAIFQFESRFMRDILRDMRCTTFEDVIAANAMGRPGPMEHIPAYCRRKRGEEKVVYPVPSLEKILKPTYGIMVYQEQVMKIVRLLAGFTASEADKVRKAMGKKKKEILDAMKEQFIKGCNMSASCAEAVAAELWTQMEAFASYAFNKSHSAGYSYTAYQCAYLKAHYPEEYMACQMTVEGWDIEYDTVKLYRNGAREMGIKVLDPDINLSKADYAVIDLPNGKKAIRDGFKGLTGIGTNAYIDIVKGQPYTDMYDYCLRAGEGSKSMVFQSLLDSHGFDCFLPKLTKRYGRQATRTDLLELYAAESKAATKMKKIPVDERPIAAFGMDEEEAPEKTLAQKKIENEKSFVLEI